MILGHSVGEAAAACAAGVLALEDGARLICARARIAERASGLGKMAAVELTVDEARDLIRELGVLLSIAAVNAPCSLTISGPAGPLSEFCDRVAARGRFCRVLDVNYPFHSALLDPLLPEMASAGESLTAQEPHTPLYSSVHGRLATQADFTPAYWPRNLRDTVQFGPAVERMAAAGCNLFVEISPHPVLSYSIRQVLQSTGAPGCVIETMHRDRDEALDLRETAAALYVQGCDPAWEALVPPGGSPISLPAYPWQRESYWIDEHPAATAAEPLLDPFLQRTFQMMGEAPAVYWEAAISLAQFPWLAGHRVQNRVIFPAAAYLLPALKAARQFSPQAALADIELHEALFLPAEGTVSMQFKFQPAAGGEWTMAIHACDPARPDLARKHVTGRVYASASAIPAMRPASFAASEQPPTSQDALYAVFRRCRLDYGAAFRGIEIISHGGGEALARLTLPESIEAQAELYGIHPATFDACIQTLVTLAPSWNQSFDSWLPRSLRELSLQKPPSPGANLLAWATLTSQAEPSANEIEGDVFLLEESGEVLLAARGLRLQRVTRAHTLDEWLYEIRWLPLPSVPPRTPATQGHWLLLADTGGVASQLGARLAQLGQHCQLIEPAAGATAIPEWIAAGDLPGRTVVDLRPLDAILPETGSASLLLSLEQQIVSHFLDLVHPLSEYPGAHPPRLALITGGSQVTGTDRGPVALAQAPLWAAARVAALEHPRLSFTRIDLPPEVEIDALAIELLHNSGEPEIALRNGVRLAPRLHLLESPGERLPLPPTRSFALHIARRGSLDVIAARAAERIPPAPHEVQIQVVAAGMNFRDLLNVLGAVDAIPLGLECSGVIAGVGSEVGGFSIGDEVIAAGLGTWRSWFNVPAVLVAPKPPNLSHEQAAAIPLAELTAYFALRHVASLRRGQRVLVHSAAGGVGLAAVHQALAAGAEIFGTAGSPAKRDILRSIGVHHVFDSRTLDFSEAIKPLAGPGLDLVLNCFPGDFIPRSLDLLIKGGHFVEIGKRGIWTHEQIATRRPDIHYEVLELAEVIRTAPETLEPMLRQLSAELAARQLPPLPVHSFPASEAVQALSFMQQARHIGKIVLKWPTPPGAPCDPAHGSWLITGGLGGLGLAVAEWLAGRGARKLVLMRRRAPDEEALAAIERCRTQGCTVAAEFCDVADEAALAAAFERMGPIRGIFHLAGVLDDAPLADLHWGRFEKVYRPKLMGAWNLHRLTRAMPIETFVLFSSWTSLTGSPGQASYASANGFLDALAHHRRAQGLPALVINWGAWRETGLAAQPGRLAHLEKQGIGSMSSREALDALAHLMESGLTQTGVSPFDAAAWRDSTPNESARRLVASLIEPLLASGDDSAADPALSLAEALREAPPGPARRQVMEACIQRRLASVLRMSAAQFDPRKPFRHLGLDSLGSLEMRNLLELDAGVQLPASLIYNHATIASLATELAARMGIPIEPAAGDPAPDEDMNALLGALQELPTEEALRLLVPELSQGEDR